MDEIKIDKDIAYPKFNEDHIKYPFNKMEIGDSFSTEKTESVRSAACSHGKRNGVKLRTKTLIENGVRVARVWRVE